MSVDKKRFLKRMWELYRENDMSVYAGYATLYLMSSVFPMLMLTIAVLNLIPGYSTEDFIEFVFRFLPDLGALKLLFLEIVNNLRSQTSSLLASVTALTTLWSASTGVSALQRGLKKITRNEKSARPDKATALLYTLLFIVMIPALLIFSVLGSVIKKLLWSLSSVFGFEAAAELFSAAMRASGAASFPAVFLMILLTFRYLPGGRGRLREHIPGAALTAALWGAFSWLFSFFITNFWKASRIYGSLASVFLAVMWLRTLFSIMFLGVAFNTVLGEMREEAAGAESVTH